MSMGSSEPPSKAYSRETGLVWSTDYWMSDSHLHVRKSSEENVVKLALKHFGFRNINLFQLTVNYTAWGIPISKAREVP